MTKPECKMPVPTGFIKALVVANKFRGRGTKLFPWLGFVELADGKLYASDNRSIVEIDLGADLGAARFTARDVAVLNALGDDPDYCSFHDGISFTWNDGRWFTSETGIDTRLSEHCRPLVEKYWREGRDVGQAEKDILDQAKAGKQNRDFKVQASDQYWHAGTIANVLSMATAYDPDVSPTPFSIPRGKGLIVQASKGRFEK